MLVQHGSEMIHERVFCLSIGISKSILTYCCQILWNARHKGEQRAGGAGGWECQVWAQAWGQRRLSLSHTSLTHNPKQVTRGARQDGVSGIGCECDQGAWNGASGCENLWSRGATQASGASISPNTNPTGYHSAAPGDFECFRIFLSKGKDL